MTLLGETVELPAVTGFAGGFSGSVSDETCGALTTTSATLTFSGSTARITEFCNDRILRNHSGFWNLDPNLK